MKKTFILLLLFMAAFSFNQVKAASYSIDEGAIDKLFDKATETSMISANASELTAVPSAIPTPLVAPKEKDAVLAIVLDFFLGGLGIHRFYLGTKTMTGLGYILTCGGIFGIVPLVDFIVLIIDNEDIRPYIDNPKFFMW